MLLCDFSTDLNETCDVLQVTLMTCLFVHVCLFVCFRLSAHSHFHLDHCGALPYMSEMVGFDGPIYMTHPTKAICPILLVSLVTVQ